MSNTAEVTPTVEAVEKIETPAVAAAPAAASAEAPKPAVVPAWGKTQATTAAAAISTTSTATATATTASRPQKKSKDEEKNWPTLEEAKSKPVPSKHATPSASGASADQDNKDVTKSNKKKQKKAWEPLKVQPKVAGASSSSSSRQSNADGSAAGAPHTGANRKPKSNRAPKHNNQVQDKEASTQSGILENPVGSAPIHKSHHHSKNGQSTLPLPKPQAGSNPAPIQNGNGPRGGNNFRAFRGPKKGGFRRGGGGGGGFNHANEINPAHFYSPEILKDQILTQIHHYFSIDNLCRDIYLRNQMDQEGYVNIEVLMPFNRLKDISSDKALILSAVANSKTIEVKEDKIRLKNDWSRWIFPLEGSDFNPNILIKKRENDAIKG
eukprot:TRINITY_DN175_c2_g1_i2.p1 TRINITY_DN175_c2_g1~~TRINITY_DN175_c2_g1_i2.p1  ORF type:complete len:381 (+),score=194.33 TRINITY_DN175_c2_g1_i2:56-1198(+)